MTTSVEQGAKSFRRLAAELGKLAGELDQHRGLFQAIARRSRAKRATWADLTAERSVYGYSQRFWNIAGQAGRLFRQFRHLPQWPQVDKEQPHSDRHPSAFWLLALDATAKRPASLADTDIPRWREYLRQARLEIDQLIWLDQMARECPGEAVTGSIILELYSTGHFAHHGRQLAVASGRACDYLADLLDEAGSRGKDDEPDQDEPKPKAWEKLELKEGPGGDIAILYGREYRLTGKNDLPFLKMLQEEQGTPIKAGSLEYELGERPRRIFDRLAPPLQAIVDRPGRGQSGYRMI